MKLTGVSCVLFLVAHVAIAASAPPTLTRTNSFPDRSAAHGKSDGPMEAVWGMLDAFANRSDTEYVAWMSQEFRFESDEPGFGPAMSRADEAQFARHLFRGGKLAPDGSPLPTATNVQLSAGPIAISGEVLPDGEALVTLPHLAATITLSDGSMLEVGDTINELRLVRTPDGWRVSRWREIHPQLAALDAVADRLAHAASAPDSASSAAAAQPRAVSDVIERVALTPRTDRRREALVFDLALPAAGGALEVYDVMGRRVMLRDLSDLRPGRHVIALDGHDLVAGVYWARARQGNSAATARIVWVR